MGTICEKTRASAGGERYPARLKAELGITQHQCEAWATYVAAVLSNRRRMEGALGADAPFGSLADRLAALAAMRRASSRLYACLNALQVIVVTVTELWSALELAAKAQRGAQHPVEDYEKHAAKYAEKILAAAKDVAAQKGVACDIIHVSDKHPADGIVETAKARGCDLIIMGSHGRRGLQRVLLGSQAAKVLAYSSMAVMICK